MKAYEYRQFGIDNLTLVQRDPPRPGVHEVLVRFHTASLNYRDLMFARGVYNPKSKFSTVPLSHGADEVAEIGEGVTRWKVSDRACTIFTQGWNAGRYPANKARTTLGGG